MAPIMQYPDHFIDRLHLIWGAGFLSPGGRVEVLEIVRGLDLHGKAVLDIGCGTGGPAMVLAGERGARVTGLDVEPELLKRARRLIGEAGLAGRIDLCLVEPGPLPFAAESFDLVFSKDALIHVRDKAGLFAEALRVLKPGGRLAASDWLRGEGAQALASLADYRRLGHLDFTMATARETENLLRAAGFREVSSRDRNAWYAPLARRESDQIDGLLKDQLIAAAGAAVHAEWAAARRALADATTAGGLRPTHLRGTKPARSDISFS